MWLLAPGPTLCHHQPQELIFRAAGSMHLHSSLVCDVIQSPQENLGPLVSVGGCTEGWWGDGAAHNETGGLGGSSTIRRSRSPSVLSGLFPRGIAGPCNQAQLVIRQSPNSHKD